MMLIAMSIFLLMSALLLLMSTFDQTVLVFRQLLVLVCVAAAMYSFSYSVRSRKIFFIDIKSGGAKLKNNQKAIKRKIEEKKVEFKLY